MDNSKPAFPRNVHSLNDNEGFPVVGLTKREWYAGMALAGFSANPDLSRAATEKFGLTPAETREAFAKSAFKQADAMIKESEK